MRLYIFLSVPSLEGLALFIQSVKCLTKSKKKSPSGTEITLSAILTNKLKPSGDRRVNRSAIFAQNSFALVLLSTSKASSVSCNKILPRLVNNPCI